MAADHGKRGALANPAPRISLAAADTSFLHDLSGYPVLTGYTASQYLDYESTQLNTFLNLIYVLLGLAIVIAVVGIVNTLALSVLERTRELGHLRAVGMTRGQVREMVAWESVIIALLGAVLGLCIGAGLGIAVVSSLHAEGITSTAVPGGNLLLYAAAAACFGRSRPSSRPSVHLESTCCVRSRRSSRVLSVEVSPATRCGHVERQQSHDGE